MTCQNKSWEFIKHGRVFRLFHRHDDLLVYIKDQYSWCQICGEKVPPGIQIQANLIDYIGWSSPFGKTAYIIDSFPTEGLVTINLNSLKVSGRKDLHPKVNKLLEEYKIK